MMTQNVFVLLVYLFYGFFFWCVCVGGGGGGLQPVKKLITRCSTQGTQFYDISDEKSKSTLKALDFQFYSEIE